MADTERKLRWGILSTAAIGINKVIPGIMKAHNCEVAAIASRNLPRAQQAAAKLGIAKAYGSYEELLDDPDIDAIYNPLPNHMHIEWTLKAAQAGKHVLCEKPIGMNTADAERLTACPHNLIIAEAFMVRYHPQWQRAREIIASAELGTVTAVRGVFSYFNTDPGNVRNIAEYGGGALLDIGCYPITGARYFFGDEPKRVIALVEKDPDFNTDKQVSVIADFGNGRHLNFIASTQAVPHQSLEIIGTKARVELLIPFNAPEGKATAILIDHGLSPDGQLSRREIIPPSDQYTEQAEAFANAALTGTKLDWGIADAIQSMRIIDACFKSAKTGQWVSL